MPAPDDIYKHDVDFTTLALQYPDFAKKLKSNRQLDFSDPESVRQLTKTLLHRDFGITIDLPEDRLCPPVPNRFNYILFLQRLLDGTSPDFRDNYDPDRQVIGLDIGTGASAIYPLLACQQRPKWLFLATEIDDKSRMYATKNIAANVLQSRIKLLDTDTTGAQLIPSKQLERFDRIDVLMTNPPFYESQESMSESARSKPRPANSSCTGAPVEMITLGGEVAFVSRLIEESGLSTHKTRVQWFSAMLGKLSSVGVVVQTLRQKGCMNFAVTEFIQGQKTRRWCVAWSWFGFRPSSAVARGVRPGVEKKFLPPPTEIEFDVHADLPVLETRISEEVEKLDLLWKYIPARRVGMLMSKDGDVWSRKARRRKIHQDQEMADDDEDEKQDEEDEEPEPALIAKITLSVAVVADGQEDGSAETNVHLRHLQGHDSVLFESFCGWLKRKVS